MDSQTSSNGGLELPFESPMAEEYSVSELSAENLRPANGSN